MSAGSVSGAARNLQYSPASISQHIIALQQTVGVPLYRKQGRGIEVTEAGLRLAEESNALFSEADRLTAVVDSLRSGPRDRLTIGCSSSVAKEWIPRVLREARRVYPDLQYDVMSNEPYTGKEHSPAQIDIFSEPGHSDVAPTPGHSREHLIDDHYMLVLPHSHPLTEQVSVSVSALADEPLVDLDVQGSPTGDVLDHITRSAGFSPRFAARADDHYGILAMVSAGIGLTVLPRLATLDLPPSLTARPLTDPAPYRRIVLHIDETVAHLGHVALVAQLIRRHANPQTARRRGRPLS